MNSKVSLAEKARSDSSQGKERIRRQQQKEQRKAHADDKALQAAERVRAAELFETAKRLIAKATKKAENSTSINIMQRSRDPSPRAAVLRAQYTQELLEAEGFKVEERSSSLEPFGSDSLFDVTVYDLDLDISW